MTTPNLANAVRVPGRLVSGPTQPGLSLPYPHGGTGFGYIAWADFAPEEAEPIGIFSPALGKRVRILRRETRVKFEFLLEERDRVALKKLYASTSNTLREPSVGGTIRPGLQPAGTPLLFAPLNTQSHDAILIFNPSFHHPRGKRNRNSIEQNLEELVVVEALDDANGHTVACDLLRNLSLT